MSNPPAYERIAALKEHHGALKLLAADSAPLVASFLFAVFIESNRRSLPYSEVESKLADYLFHLQGLYGEDTHKRSAREYIENWAGEKGFLNKYYTALSDDPELDITPDAEKALAFLQSLENREFVGTESRLQTVFQLLREMLQSAEQDPARRIADLEAERAKIDREIAEIRGGYLRIPDATHIKERFLQAQETARHLLGDFRQVEFNFKKLDRRTREKIAASEAAKGALLDEIFGEQDSIRETDQGRSFIAFWEFLMSPGHQAELSLLIERAYELEAIAELGPDDFLRKIRYYLLDAGDKVYLTQSRLAEQLRKYLDDRVYLENRRIMRVIQRIEKKALGFKDNPPSPRDFMLLDEVHCSFHLVLSRGLFAVPERAKLGDLQPINGLAEIEADLLYRQNYVDEGLLIDHLRRALQERSQITLRDLTHLFPIEKGLAEVVTYFKLATGDGNARIAVDERDELQWESAGVVRFIELPRVIFSR